MKLKRHTIHVNEVNKNTKRTIILSQQEDEYEQTMTVHIIYTKMFSMHLLEQIENLLQLYRKFT